MLDKFFEGVFLPGMAYTSTLLLIIILRFGMSVKVGDASQLDSSQSFTLRFKSLNSKLTLVSMIPLVSFSTTSIFLCEKLNVGDIKIFFIITVAIFIFYVLIALMLNRMAKITKSAGSLIFIGALVILSMISWRFFETNQNILVVPILISSLILAFIAWITFTNLILIRKKYR